MARRTPALSPTSIPARAGRLLLDPALKRISDLLRHPHRLTSSRARIHKLRVATRRAQAALLILEPCLSAATSRRFLNQLRKLRRAAGKVRDADLIARTLKAEQASRGRQAAKPPPQLFRDLKARQRDAADRLRSRAKRRRSKINDAHKTAKKDLDRSGNSPDLAQLARRRLEALHTEINRLAGGNLSDPARLHRLRRRLKLLRYSLEMLEPVLPRSSVRDVGRLRKLQRALGRWTDLRTTLIDLDKRAAPGPSPSHGAQKDHAPPGPHQAASTRARRDTPARDNPVARLRAVVSAREITARGRALRAVQAWETGATRSRRPQTAPVRRGSA